jgi:isopenicillin-N N-acyltransferase-like protein
VSAREFPVLTVGDDAEERGRRHGERFARQIGENVEIYLERFAASGLDREAALTEGEAWDRSIAEKAPEYGAEMRAIAAAAGRTRGELALLNARYEIAFTLFGRDARKADGPAAEPDGCTTLGLLPEATANGHTLMAQNWDWLSALRGNCLILRIERTARPSLVCLTEAGIVGGKMGVNSVGIGLVENGLAGPHDGKNPYEKPFHVRCREVLDGANLNDAMLPVVATRRTCSGNFVVGCASGEIVDLETSPDEVAPLHPVGGIITHSNHFLDRRHGRSQMERLAPNTLFRAARLDRLLRRDLGRLDLAKIRAALSDHTGYPSALCRHSDERQPAVRHTMTLASVVLDLDERAMWIAEGPPCESDYIRIDVTDGARLAA